MVHENLIKCHSKKCTYDIKSFEAILKVHKKPHKTSFFKSAQKLEAIQMCTKMYNIKYCQKCTKISKANFLKMHKKSFEAILNVHKRSHKTSVFKSAQKSFEAILKVHNFKNKISFSKVHKNLLKLS